MGSSAPWKFQPGDTIIFTPQGSQPRLIVVTEIDLENERYGFDGLFGNRHIIEANSILMPEQVFNMPKSKKTGKTRRK
jgi:hypothetical protein